MEYQKYFKRIEEKYILDYYKYLELMEKIENKISEDKYPNSKILNIYYDTDSYNLAINSIQKPVFKEKIRLRSYNVPKNDNDLIFLEIKRKYNGVTYKRRISLNLLQYKEFLKTGKLQSDDSKQITEELRYTLNKYNLVPKIMIAYDRKSFYLKENTNIRLTFDFNLRSRIDNLDFILADAGKSFFNDKKCILEIKSCENMPIWLVKILNSLKVYPVSFSKYGEIYKEMIIKNSKKGR